MNAPTKDIQAQKPVTQATSYINMWQHGRLNSRTGDVFFDEHEAAEDAQGSSKGFTYLYTLILKDGEDTARVVGLGRDSISYATHPADRRDES